MKVGDGVLCAGEEGGLTWVNVTDLLKISTLFQETRSTAVVNNVSIFLIPSV